MSAEYSNLDFVEAHQYLYYVRFDSILSDFKYDRFCSKHGIHGGGGSDLADDYSERIVELANKIRSG